MNLPPSGSGYDQAVHSPRQQGLPYTGTESFPEEARALYSGMRTTKFSPDSDALQLTPHLKPSTEEKPKELPARKQGISEPQYRINTSTSDKRQALSDSVPVFDEGALHLGSGRGSGSGQHASRFMSGASSTLPTQPDDQSVTDKYEQQIRELYEILGGSHSSAKVSGTAASRSIAMDVSYNSSIRETATPSLPSDIVRAEEGVESLRALLLETSDTQPLITERERSASDEQAIIIREQVIERISPEKREERTVQYVPIDSLFEEPDAGAVETATITSESSTDSDSESFDLQHDPNRASSHPARLSEGDDPSGLHHQQLDVGTESLVIDRTISPEAVGDHSLEASEHTTSLTKRGSESLVDSETPEAEAANIDWSEQDLPAAVEAQSETCLVSGDAVKDQLIDDEQLEVGRQPSGTRLGFSGDRGIESSISDTALHAPGGGDPGAAASAPAAVSQLLAQEDHRLVTDEDSVINLEPEAHVVSPITEGIAGRVYQRLGSLSSSSTEEEFYEVEPLADMETSQRAPSIIQQLMPGHMDEELHQSRYEAISSDTEQECRQAATATGSSGNVQLPLTGVMDDLEESVLRQQMDNDDIDHLSSSMRKESRRPKYTTTISIYMMQSKRDNAEEKTSVTSDRAPEKTDSEHSDRSEGAVVSTARKKQVRWAESVNSTHPSSVHQETRKQEESMRTESVSDTPLAESVIGAEKAARVGTPSASSDDLRTRTVKVSYKKSGNLQRQYKEKTFPEGSAIEELQQWLNDTRVLFEKSYLKGSPMQVEITSKIKGFPDSKLQVAFDEGKSTKVEAREDGTACASVDSPTFELCAASLFADLENAEAKSYADTAPGNEQ
ncbi:hypothetical protein [Endozoicomonas sp. SCSIO W0465]|uniref:hypothetical protein n=1 Tax=Endozoicomonas sp. SCSIO W0465 TaxID=2918516 RepID=UPI0020760E10|nr:hypothetical protein [Endozoicomonas sp. SCSIO W0465]USE38518.1 hypothetical protein MJO57_10310 [Endozoicomonas sp. SCSIO W0465]